MARRLEKFPYTPIVRELLELSRAREGVWGVMKSEDAPRLTETAVVRRGVTAVKGRPYREQFVGVLRKACEELETEPERAAAKARLGLSNRQATPRLRTEDAAEALECAPSTFLHSIWEDETAGVWKKSREVILFEALEEGLFRLGEVGREYGLTPVGHAPAEDVREIWGSWRGLLQTNWRSAEGKRPGPMRSYMVFDTEGDRLVTRHYVGDGKSVMVSQQVIVTSERFRRLLGIYEAEPSDPSRSHDDPPHRGAMLLDLKGPDPETVVLLEGFYFTARETSGTLRYTEWSRGRAHSFEHAEGLDYEPRG